VSKKPFVAPSRSSGVKKRAVGHLELLQIRLPSWSGSPEGRRHQPLSWIQPELVLPHVRQSVFVGTIAVTGTPACSTGTEIPATVKVRNAMTMKYCQQLSS